MTSFDWSVLTASLAGGIGVALIAMTALRRRRTRRRTEYAQIGSEGGRKRIEVVAINDANPEPDGSTIERK
jgi:small neutral amino acid transporter SnatA (MarC family)